MCHSGTAKLVAAFVSVSGRDGKGTRGPQLGVGTSHDMQRRCAIGFQNNTAAWQIHTQAANSVRACVKLERKNPSVQNLSLEGDPDFKFVEPYPS